MVDTISAVEPLNAFLSDLHGPTDDIARTMSRLVPFPRDIGSFPDADLLDLNVSVRVNEADSDRASVQAQARYTTGARLSQVHAFYLAEFTRVGAAFSLPSPSSRQNGHVLSATLPDPARTRCRVMVDSFGGCRWVKVIVNYDGYDHRDLFSRFAHWHNGRAPVDAHNRPTGVEIGTFANGREPGALVLYSTDYRCRQTPWADRRAMVDSRINELGWTYREPREGILFIQTGNFDAETHVLGDNHSSSVRFVGEFHLR